MKAVKTLREFKSRRILGQVEFFSYQVAVGASVRYLECDGGSWMFRFYLGPFKLWFHIR